MKEANSSRRKFLARGAQGGGALALTAASWNNIIGAADKVRLGVIGTGNRGGDVMSWFLKEPDCEVTAICDVYDQNLNSAKEKTEGKAKAYTDYRALLDDKNVDAVLIATPDPWHVKMATDACKAGKDVYVEKPLTFTIEEGHEMIRVTKATNRVLQVGLQQRSGEHYRECKAEIIDKGKLGKLAIARTWWHGNTYHLRTPKFKDKPAGLDWKAFLGPVKYREFDAHQFYNWRAYLDFGGGQITDLFTHWIDVVHWYAGEEIPIVANATGGVFNYKDGRTAPDTLSIQLEYPSQWIATFEASLVPGASGAAIELMGSEGNLYIDRSGYKFTEKFVRKADTPRPEPIVRKAARPLEQDHVRNFLACVKSRQTPNSDVVSGHRSALASHLGKMAYVQKKRILFDPAKEREHTMANKAGENKTALR